MHDMKFYRILILIAGHDIAEKAEALLSEEGIPVQYSMKVHGTASSEIMNMFGLGTPEKDMLVTVVPQKEAAGFLRLFRKKLYLGMPNTGIAFTIPVSGGSKRLFELVDLAENKEGDIAMAEEGRDSSMIIAIVDQGASEDVMKAARPAGATGGTVFHSRRLGEENAVKLWGISVQEEREIVMILARNSRKKEIMDAINNACGMATDSHGVVFSVPIADIEGIG